MHPKDLKWFDLLNVDEAAGTIHFQHRRLLLFDADAMGLLRKQLIETLGLERARRSSPVLGMRAAIGMR